MKNRIFLGAALFLAGLDQATKAAARSALGGIPEGRAVRIMAGVLYLKPTTNAGGIWGILGGFPPWVFAAVSGVFVGYLAWLILRLETHEHGYLPALALLLGGFIGNGVDRILNGYVTDFIYFTGYPPSLISTFNVADLAILLGMAWLLGRFALARARPREAAP